MLIIHGNDFIRMCMYIMLCLLKGVKWTYNWSSQISFYANDLCLFSFCFILILTFRWCERYLHITFKTENSLHQMMQRIMEQWKCVNVSFPLEIQLYQFFVNGFRWKLTAFIADHHSWILFLISTMWIYAQIINIDEQWKNRFQCKWAYMCWSTSNRLVPCLCLYTYCRSYGYLLWKQAFWMYKNDYSFRARHFCC